MTYEVVWGFPVALYLFLGGMTSAAFYLGVLAELFSKGKYRNLARIGSYTILVPIVIGLFMLLVDLGRPLSFWHLMIQSQPSWHLVLQTGSVMSIGVWLLVIYIIICGVIYPAFWLAEESVGSRLPIVNLLKGKEKLRKIIGYIGIFPAFLVSIYTGVLLAVSSISLWGTTPFIPILFVASAGTAGIASLIIALYCVKQLSFEVMEKLVKAETVFVCLEFLTVFVLIVTLLFKGQALEAIKAILGGSLAVLFWIGFVLAGAILPYLMNHYHLKLRNGEKRLPVVASVLSLFGSLFLRYLVLMAGYIR